MKIREVLVTTYDLEAAAGFYRDQLHMPVDVEADRVTVTVGSSRLILARGKHFDGVHHLAFGISPRDLVLARTWLNQGLTPIVAGNSEVIDGPDGWNSQSVYFLGPEDILLEFIARQADAKIPGSDRAAPQPLSISEVGIGVPDVGAAVRELTDRLGLSTFPPQESQFAPIGEHDGLLIVVDQERIWFPTQTHRAARGPLTVRIEAPRPGDVALTDQVTITTSASVA